MSLKIALVGYGRMGRTVEAEALERGHQIVATIDTDNLEEIDRLTPDFADVVIEFTRPENALRNYDQLLKKGVHVVTGTTGWYDQVDEVKSWVDQAAGAFLYASNFSIGVNILFQLNQQLAQLMNRYGAYDPFVMEAHHRHKKDGPSGTAVSLADQVVDGLDRKSVWVTDELHHRPPNPEEVSVGYVRAGAIFGEHQVTYTSEIDELTISHKAYGRRGFALGAVIAAEWIQGKKGFFNFQEVFAGVK